MSKIPFLILCLLLPTLAGAQDDPEFLELGGDLYGGGSAVVVTDAVVHDVFLGAQETTQQVSVFSASAANPRQPDRGSRCFATPGENLGRR